MDNDLKKLGLKGRLKFLFRDSVVYGGAGAISKLLAFFTFPILTRYFSVEQYGVIDVFTVLSGLLVTIFIFGQDSAVARYFYEYEGNKQRKDVISQSLTIQLITIACFLPLLFLYSAPLAHLFVDTEKAGEIATLILWQIPFGLLINFSGNILKWTLKKYQFLFLNIGSTASYLLCIIIGIRYFNIGIIDIFALLLVTRVVFGLIGLLMVHKWLTIRFSTRNYMELLKYGVPYGIICVISGLLPASDRFFISRYLSTKDLGLYAAGYKIVFILKFPVQAFQTAWGPFYLSIFKEQNATTTYNAVLMLYTLGLSLIALFVVTFSRPILIFLSGVAYAGGAPVIFPLALGLVIKSVGELLSIGIDLSTKSYLKTYSYSIGLITTVVSVYFLISPWGILGVGMGVLIGNIFQASFESYMSYRAYGLSFRFTSVVLILLGLFAIGLLIFMVDMFTKRALIIKGIILAVVFLAPLLLKKVRSVLLMMLNKLR